MRAARGLRAWIPRHQLSPCCWCRPGVEEAMGGFVVSHRMLVLAPDVRPRAFVPLREGPPA